MCTVTYIPTNDGFYLTSNRDEHHLRSPALAPAIYKACDSDVLYPKDPDKNGSWIAAKATGNVVVLLNGAFVKHVQKPTYTISRGTIVLEAIGSDKPDVYFKTANLVDVEPFTLVVCANKLLYECRWDGNKRHLTPLDTKRAYIWSSPTLYNEATQAYKARQFKKWLKSDIPLDSSSVMGFHESERLSGPISTVSFTSIQMSSGQITMTYDDLKTGSRHVEKLNAFKQKIPWLGLRIFFVKLFNWEYWPYYMVYIPVMFYWLWLSIKSRSIFFFNTANPGMKNGGFAMDNKNDIYVHIPSQHCPKTLLIKAGTALDFIGMQLPLIAKPDIGQRGLQVKLLKTLDDLAEYARNSKVDFLLQEYISFPNEAGIFYSRMPGSNKGTVTGIVGKELMNVTGDGKSTILELLVKNPRYLLQIQSLTKTDSSMLQNILPVGETYYPAPYGNHSRGAKFSDLSHQISLDPLQHIDAVCKKIPGFFYGRLDIKYNSWSELCAGRFMIIEVNGAASEPAHIYDPKHSIFFAWKEIIRHWDILYRISKQNRHSKGLVHMTYREGMSMIKNNKQYVNLTTA